MDFFGWEDLDGDGHVDEVESLLADDLMCTNDEEREMNDGIGGLGPTSGAFGLESGLDGDVDEWVQPLGRLGWKVVLTAMWMRNFMMDWK